MELFVIVMKATWHMLHTKFSIDIRTDSFPADEIFERCFVKDDTM
jgi:hypothetical protein